MTLDDEQAAFPSGPLGDSMTFGDGRTTHQYPAQPGMSLRDWFAGKALAGMVAAPGSYKSIARCCYAQADAMMEAREAKQ